jgi:hypothetical protein
LKFTVRFPENAGFSGKCNAVLQEARSGLAALTGLLAVGRTIAEGIA